MVSSETVIVIFVLLLVSSEGVKDFSADDLNTDLRFIKTCNGTSPISLSKFLLHHFVAFPQF